MAGGVDLHTHTTCSDGTLAPRALVAEAIKRGVRVLAVTDHDSTDGLTEAIAAAQGQLARLKAAGYSHTAPITS